MYRAVLCCEQAVQGFSGIRVYGESEQNKYFWILTDNGMGNKRNSPDALLMFHKVVPDWGKKTVKRTQ